MQDIHRHKILIIDFGSQTTQLIARRVREIGVYCEILPYDSEPGLLTQITQDTSSQVKGIILSGGPESVTETTTPRIDPVLFDCGVPILGICYGMQTMVHQLGGQVASANQREFGHAFLHCIADKLWENIAADQLVIDVWMSHTDRVIELPAGFTVIASSEHSPLAAIANPVKKFYGVQFHPEVTHTQYGQQILANFVNNICRCDNLWNTDNLIEELISDIRQQVGNQQVLLALSGGVDSAVVAALLNRAIGEQLHCVFIDNGLLRLGEADQVMRVFNQQLGIDVVKVDAQQQFLSALVGITEPEQKRKIIGKLFIECFDQQAEKLADVADIKWLAQGTIYPDVVESAGTKTGKATVIKSHHNVGGLPENLSFKLLEPLRELFKDEVRNIGEKLALPANVVRRHPFPGPGLSVRVIGEVKPEYLDLLRRADKILIDSLHEYNLYHQVSQALAVFLPIKSVGVMGDKRSYGYVVVIRCVETNDFMTAKWSRLPDEFLHQVASRIINEIDGITRVTYDIVNKPPATIEWE